MLPDRETGELREVDAAIRQMVGGHSIIVQVEATARGRVADVKWVEAELGKFRAVGTNKLVLVSEAGFSSSARAKAEQNGAVVLSPEDMTGEDPSFEVVNAVGSVRPLTYSLRPKAVKVTVQAPDGLKKLAVPPDLDAVTGDGFSLGSIGEILLARMNQEWRAFADQIDVPEGEEGSIASFQLAIPDWSCTLRREDGETEQVVVCLRWQPDPKVAAEMHPILLIEALGEAQLEASEVPLTHFKLGDKSVAFGTGKLDGSDALLVFTEDGEGGKGTIRLRDESGRDQTVTSDLIKDD